MFYCIKYIPLEPHEIDFYLDNDLDIPENPVAFLTWQKDLVEFSWWDGLMHPYRDIFSGPGDRWTPETISGSTPSLLLKNMLDYEIDINRLDDFTIKSFP